MDTMEEWRKEVEEGRAETTDYFMEQFNWRGAPKPEEFTGPKWYPVSAQWVVKARLDKDAPGTGARVQLQTSIGDLRDFDVAGTLVFTIDGQEQKLAAYSVVPATSDFDDLFVPFKDATTGKESYGAGRYMDIPSHVSSSYVIDFNQAYNPLCAYSPRYNCPYPPPQNTLKVAIEAGEKIPFSREDH